MKTNTLIALLFAFCLASSGRAQEPSVKETSPITINIIGGVKQASRITLPKGATILDALASAGGVTVDGNLKRVKIIHQSTAEKPNVTRVNVKEIFDGKAPNIILHDGETIDVPKAFIHMQF